MDKIFGQAGNNTLNRGAGNDLLFGDVNDDIIPGGDDDDIIKGGNGSVNYLEMLGMI